MTTPTHTHPGHALGPILARKDTTLPVSEVFGPTVQGEGPHAGRVASFVRIGLCNLACQWCDTPWTWDRDRYDLRKENPSRIVTDICDQVEAHGTPLTVITGGEPLIHQANLAFGELLIGLSALGERHVETNGTLTPTEHTRALVGHFSVSPKLRNNGADPETRRVKPGALKVFASLADQGRACFKFVVQRPSDLYEVDKLVKEHKVPRDAVWIMPEGTTVERIAKTHHRIADAVVARRYNMSGRMHITTWGDVRGR